MRCGCESPACHSSQEEPAVFLSRLSYAHIIRYSYLDYGKKIQILLLDIKNTSDRCVTPNADGN